MSPWSVLFDAKAGVYRHSTREGFGHPLLAALVGHVFEALGVSVTLCRDREWLPIHTEARSIIRFEIEHGLTTKRAAYNTRQMSLARERKRASLGEYGGYSDWFVPVIAAGQCVGMLVAGPLVAKAPSSADVLERWHWLTGRVGHLADPEFSLYLRETLGLVVLEPERMAALGRLLECYAQLLSGEGRADELANQANVLRLDLERARFAERTWATVQMMLDERSARSTFDDVNASELRKLGLSRAVDFVLVGLMVNQTREPDPVDEAVRRHAFQRRTVVMARELRDALSGQVGDHGIVFLSATAGKAKKQKAANIAERAALIARKEFGLSVYFGAAPIDEGEPLNQSYQAALAAAESALTHETRFLVAEAAPKPSARSLRELREELVRVEERPALLAARFERYLEAVSVASGQRTERAATHLEVGFEAMTANLVEAGVLEAKGLKTIEGSLARSAAAAGNLKELFAVYRRAVTDLTDAVQRPVPARQDRSLRRAVEYIHQRYAKPLRAEEVARVAGFTRSHFSKLFIQRERMPFEDYVMKLRLERSQHLLTDTKLRITRVAELSGFGSAQYFCRVFRKKLDETPLQFRKSRKYRVGPGTKSQKQTHQSPKIR